MKTKYLFLLPFRSFLFIIIFFLIVLFTNKTLFELSSHWSIVIIFCNIITFLIILYISKKEKITFCELINYKKGNTKIFNIIFLSIVSIIVGIRRNLHCWIFML